MTGNNIFKTIENQILREELQDFICLDIGISFIKAVYVKNNKINNFFIAENQGKSLDIFKDWAKKQGLFSKPVKIALKGPDTLIRYIPFAKVGKTKLKETFRYSLSQQVPFKEEEIYFDLALVNENYSPDNYLLLLAVAKKIMIDDLVQNCQHARINLKEITHQSVALANIAIKAFPLNVYGILVDIGYTSTILTVVGQNQPYLSREVHILFHHDNQQDALQNVLREIKSSIDYCEVNLGKTIENLYLSGGVIKKAGLVEDIQKNLSMNVEVFNPLQAVSGSQLLDLEKYKEIMTTVIASTL